MEEKVLEIINSIRVSKGLNELLAMQPESDLRNDIEFTSFDLAELTVKIEDEFDIDIFEDGLVNTVNEIYQKLKTV
jgi:acyl carrier protein